MLSFGVFLGSHSGGDVMSLVAQNENTSTSFLTTIVGGIVALIGGLSTAEQLAAIGVLITLAGFVVNTWYIWRKDRREQRLFESTLKGDDDNEAA